MSEQAQQPSQSAGQASANNLPGAVNLDDIREQYEHSAKDLAEQIDNVIASAEELLSRRFGGMQQLSDVQRLDGSGTALVLRARVAASPFLQQRSVVVKYTPSNGNDLDESALMREIVAYQFTTSLSEDVRPGPVLLAYDLDKRLLVISDSGDGDTFAELLQAQDPQLRLEILRNLGEALGKMHAGTALKEPHWEILLHRMVAKHPSLEQTISFRERLLKIAIAVGMELVSNAGFEVDETTKALALDANRRLTAGHHRAFTPFDLSPDNIIVANTTHFLDYEWAGFRDAAFDLACVIAGFPQYVFATPISDLEADVFIEAWVHQVNTLWPNVNNTSRLHARILTALVGWTFASVAMMHFSTNVEAFDKLFWHVLNNEDAHVDVATTMQMVGTSTSLLAAVDAPVGPHSGEGVDAETIRLARKDLLETFQAIARFAARNSDTRFPSVEHFAQSVIARLQG